jgi:hypothetical protein
MYGLKPVPFNPALGDIPAAGDNSTLSSWQVF